MQEHQTNSTEKYYVSTKLYERLAARLLASEADVLNSRHSELHQIQYLIGKVDGLKISLNELYRDANNQSQLPEIYDLRKELSWDSQTSSVEEPRLPLLSRLLKKLLGIG